MSLQWTDLAWDIWYLLTAFMIREKSIDDRYDKCRLPENSTLDWWEELKVLVLNQVYREKQDFIQAAKDELSVLSLWILKSFLKHAGFRMPNMFHDIYEVITLEPIHVPHFSASKKLKENLIVCFSSETILFNLGQRRNIKMPLVKVQKAELHRFKAHLTVIEMM